MPSDIIADLQQSTLCFIKGDANYRRLLGDREWPLSLPFGHVVSYWPCPVAPLRTLKAELGCGMAADKVQAAKDRDPKDWMVTGKYGTWGLYGYTYHELCAYRCMCACALSVPYLYICVCAAGVVQFQLPE